jgi:hypothetical protein
MPTSTCSSMHERIEAWLKSTKDTSKLRAFARACALDVIDLWDVPEQVREYLRTGDENLRETTASCALVAWADAWADENEAAAEAAWAANAASSEEAAASAARTAFQCAIDAAAAKQHERLLAIVADLDTSVD